MSEYSIKDLERLSGIKAHTLRIWEKRYNIIEPARTDTNIRYYTDENLKKILNVVVLNENGYKISKIVGLSDTELKELVHDIALKNNSTPTYVDTLVINMLELDEKHFVSRVNEIVEKIGVRETIYQVFYPFLIKIGVMWQIGLINPGHEHFISNLIRQKIIVEIDKLPLTTNTNEKNVILFLPDGELHELGLLFYHYLARDLGFNTLYLGESVPFQDLQKIHKHFKSNILITSFTQAEEESNIEYKINLLADFFEAQKIFIGGLQLLNYTKTIPPNCVLFNKLAELDEYLKKI